MIISYKKFINILYKSCEKDCMLMMCYNCKYYKYNENISSDKEKYLDRNIIFNVFKINGITL